jgi:type I restriction enzyme S subunit
MEATTQKIDLNKLDKSNWESFRFDEIALKISETVDPNSTELETYIGLEHIDANDIHIRRKGTPDDVSGGKLKCYPGDIIFGKRRAYQRKAAIVDFEGICSAHAFVFRANPEVIDPNLFPFFLHSDQFMHRMVDISVGGLSPTINWGDLKHQEFLLPPKDQQAQLAELLWAMDEVIERERELLDCKVTISKSFIHSFLKGQKNEQLIKLGDICTPKQWKTIPIKELTNEGYVVYGGNGIIGKYKDYTHEDSVIAIACRGEYCGNVHYTIPKSYVTGNSMCIDNLNTSLFRKKYLFYVLYYSNLDSIISGSAQPQIIKSDVERFKVAGVSIDKQEHVINIMDKFWHLEKEITTKISDSKALHKSLINQIF